MKVKFSAKELFHICSIALAAILGLTLRLQAQQDTPQVEDRVQNILSQMTLDEKLSYISGVGFNFGGGGMGVFNIKPIPRPGLPEIFGGDGTIGIVGQGAPPERKGSLKEEKAEPAAGMRS